MTVPVSPNPKVLANKGKSDAVRFEAGLLDYCDECGVMSVLHGADFDFMMEARRNLCGECWYDPSESTPPPPFPETSDAVPEDGLALDVSHMLAHEWMLGVRTNSFDAGRCAAEIISLAEAHFRGAIADEIEALPVPTYCGHGGSQTHYRRALQAATNAARGSVSPPLAGDRQ